MRRKIHLATGTENNSVTDKWVQLLIQRIIVEQLDIPPRLKAKLLSETLIKERNEENNFEEKIQSLF